jgi:hypothetical protein
MTMGSRGLLLLGVSLLSVLVCTILLWVIVDRGTTIKSKERDNTELARQFNAKLEILRGEIETLRSSVDKKADRASVVSIQQLEDATRALVHKGDLQDYAKAGELQKLKANVASCLKALPDNLRAMARGQSAGSSQSQSQKPAASTSAGTPLDAACSVFVSQSYSRGLPAEGQ